MRISKLKTNRIVNPLGFDVGQPRLSYVVTDTTAAKQAAAQIVVSKDETFEEIVYDSGKSDCIANFAFELSLKLSPRTRYYWRVTVWADNGDTATSEAAWFETAKLDEQWNAQWITPALDPDIHPVLIKEFHVEQDIKSARAYVCGLGLYEMELNGRKAGDEYLAPNFNAYDKWLQYQTYDITDLLTVGDNKVEVALGNGLYKGRFGFNGGEDNYYGDRFSLLCEIVIHYTDGSTVFIGTDRSWQSRKSAILASGLYDGEVLDGTFADASLYETMLAEVGYSRLKARLSLPVVMKERRKPVEVIRTPAGETVLDLGQNMVGWIEFQSHAPRGAEIVLQYGELLQDGNFYRDNLRTALAEFRYISDGSHAVVRPRFTFFGFRYVKVSGWHGDAKVDDFTGCVLYSDMETTGHIETSHSLVNRLFTNAMWGQKGNFLDVPTDCPQRDERMGWTGDAQVFASTASYNMDTYAFFAKYSYDLWQEQAAANGCVPMVVPSFNLHEGGSSAWGDAATVIPWTVYVQYGDKAILKQQLDSMKAWVDYIKRADDESGGKRLWTVGFHFGDWLALDGDDPNAPMGGTDRAFIASSYYCYSSALVAKAARALGQDAMAEQYDRLSNEIKTAIRNEYFTNTGRLALQTQTAYVLALFMDLVPDTYRDRIASDLRERLKRDNNHLKTGFVGTPYLCRVLSDNGCNDLAYTLLLNKDYPSWLYAVTMGATTIWERWNSVLPDGRISGTDMNSLNHYAYGSIAEWMYRTMAGINPVESKPGFQEARLAPKPDYRLKYVKAYLESAVGRYESEWELQEDGKLTFRFLIPFHATATIELPDALLNSITMNGMELSEAGFRATQQGETVHVDVNSGTYVFEYMPAVSYIKYYNVDMPIKDLMKQEETHSALSEYLPQLLQLPSMLTQESLKAHLHKPFLKLTVEALDEIDAKLNKIRIHVEQG
ncbi:alpha-L-rhamnosidase [Paenibacillus cellulosilyticus]|uniref:alpha-L-rhamnosidase n=1 Tax=Paenibacillus cellulosilyticus TaxID=375489 RepID=A0A2V2YES8_9BACL|nr:alpha-L-rhamnosidase [Paenibacillus cellulosilyticus]PWV90994.1 alpha-L-rhamnosidase [Paenibacillus cellulosilyticus]QKS45208.1 family 78 glycoside hydrolase catalytic domain [Paenibacillus cellulosilyticus]